MLETGQVASSGVRRASGWRVAPRMASWTSAGAAICAIALGGALVYFGPAVVAVSIVGVGVAASIRWPLPLYGAYLYLGVFKIEPAAQGLPIDATAAVFFLLVLICALRALTGRARRVPAAFLAALAALGVWMAMSVAWSPAAAFGNEKLAYFVTLSMLAALAPFFLLESREDLQLLLVTIVGLAILAAVLSVASGPSELHRLQNDVRTSRHISTGRLICASALILTFAHLPRSQRIAAVPSAALLVALALAFGSRGALIALVIAGAYAVAVRHRTQVRVIVSVAATLVLVTVLVSLGDFSPLAVERVTTAITNPLDTVNADPRGSFYDTALAIVRDHPLLGIGVGGFATFSYQLADPAAIYPHNIILEFAAELGLPAALLFLGVSLMAIIGITRAGLAAGRGHDSSLVLVVGTLLVFHLVAAQLSSDINGNRPLWGFLGLAYFISRYGISSGGTGRDAAERRPTWRA